MLNVVIRSVATILVGILLVVQRDVIMPVIVQCVGIAFILPGIIALVSLFVGSPSKKQRTSLVMPIITSVGSIALGVWLLSVPLFFVAIFMNLLGVLLLLLGIYQITMLLMSKKYCNVAIYLFFMPLLLVVLGIFVLLKPFGAASLPFLLVGIGAIVGGLSDLISSLVVRRSNRNRQVLLDLERTQSQSTDDDE